MHHHTLRPRPLWLLLALLLLLIGCAAPEGDAPAPDSASPAPPTLTLWFALPRSEETLLRRLVQEWVAARDDGTTVQLRAFTSADELSLKLSAAIQSETPPSLAFIRPTDLAGYIEANGVLPLDSFIASGPDAVSEAESDDLYSNFFDAVRGRDGHQYGWPVSRDQTLLFINRTRVEELGERLPPRSWDELVHLCMRHMQSGGTNCLSAYPTGNTTVLWIWAHGGRVLNDQGTAPTFQGEEGKAVLEWLAQLRAVDGVQAASSYEAKVAAFVTGNSLFAFDSTAALPAYEGRINSRFDMAVMPPPSTGAPVTVASGENIALFRQPPEQAALSWNLVRFLTAAANNEEWAEVAGAYPIRHSSLKAMDARWPQFSRMRQAAPWLDNARAEPMVPAWRDVQAALSEAMIKTITGEESPERALVEAARRCEGLLR